MYNSMLRVPWIGSTATMVGIRTLASRQQGVFFFLVFFPVALRRTLIYKRGWAREF